MITTMFRQLPRRWGVAVSLMWGCHRVVAVPDPVGPSVRDGDPAPRVESTPRAASPVLRPFAWEHVRVLGNDAKLDGPGLAGAAKVGERVALLAPDGTTRVTEIETVDHAACEGDDEACSGVWIALPDVEDPPPWAFPGLRDTSDVDTGPDDVVLVEATLAVTGDMALPELVPHALEVRYFDALCEGDADDSNFVRLARVTSKTSHPLAGMSALAPFRGRPQRVVTLRTLGRSFHFVSITSVDMPKSRRMTDVPRRRRETLFIVEGDGASARVLHTESQLVGRNVLHDHACQLPVHHPIPWTVVEVDAETFVLTRTGLDVHDRWLVATAELRRVGGWTADVLELF